MFTNAFVVLLLLHAAIHVIGFAKAFGLLEVPGVTGDISPVRGLVWLAAAVVLTVAAVLVGTRPRLWWIAGLVGVGVSMAVIVPSWRDAGFGALVNLVVLIGVGFGALTYGPTSLRAAYDADVRLLQGAVESEARPVVTEADLEGLPVPVQRYLRVSGVVGRPRARAVAVRLHGRIRSGPAAAWMPFAAEQVDTFGPEPSRAFYMTATRAALPLQGYHRFIGAPATMQIRAAGMVPIVDLGDEALTQSETVTLFNDIALLAPSNLLDGRVGWPARPARVDDTGRPVVRGTFTHLGRTVGADLVFGADGGLVDFVSDDRFVTTPEGAQTRMRWSTPVGSPRRYEGLRLASTGEGRWHEGEASWVYIELTIDAVESR